MTKTPVVYIILDGVRKDRLSLYGHERETSPNLDSVAEDSIIFENAYTPGPWSLPAHTSMLTGLYPSEHGMTNVFSNESIAIPESWETIADVLAKDGYKIGGFSNNPWLGETSSLDNRFDLFLEWDLQFSTIPDDWELNFWERYHSRLHRLIGNVSGQPLALMKDDFFVSRALSSAERWVSLNSAPTYTFVNLMGAHTPYYPSRSAFKKIGVDLPSLFELRRLDMSIMREAIQENDFAQTYPERIREVYDTSIRSQDEQLGEFINSLKERGLYDDMMIIIAADHGKTLGEFNRNDIPSHYLRDLNVNVPLVIKLPNRTESMVIKKPFEMINMFDLLREDEYTSTWLQEHTTEYALIEDYTPHTGSEEKEITQWRALTDGQCKYIIDNHDNEYFMQGTGPEESLVDNLDKKLKMKESLNEKITELDDSIDNTNQGSPQLDDSVESKLKELGYLN